MYVLNPNPVTGMLDKCENVAHIVKLFKKRYKIIFTWNAVQLSGLGNPTGKIMFSLKAGTPFCDMETVIFVHRDKDKLSGCLLIAM